jgi:thiamine biosynthesis lipoprotein
MKSVLSEIRRARPLLGTFVEITAQGPGEALLHRAINEAFSAVGAVHRLMSVHDSASDVSRLNSQAARRPIRVHPWTRRVLLAAKQFSRETGGAWDITVAPPVRDACFQPERGARDSCSDWRAIVVRGDGRVYFRRPLLIDLGGIAKGFAVDRATETLISAGARSGVVNAGGDLRVFGSKPRTVHIRDPLDPGRWGRTISLRETSLATSTTHGSGADFANQNPIIDGRTHQPVPGNLSASVCARDCMTADALTKLVLAIRHEAEPILRRYQAQAFFSLANQMDPRSFLCPDPSAFCSHTKFVIASRSTRPDRKLPSLLRSR